MIYVGKKPLVWYIGLMYTRYWKNPTIELIMKSFKLPPSCCPWIGLAIRWQPPTQNLPQSASSIDTITTCAFSMLGSLWTVSSLGPLFYNLSELCQLRQELFKLQHAHTSPWPMSTQIICNPGRCSNIGTYATHTIQHKTHISWNSMQLGAT